MSFSLAAILAGLLFYSNETQWKNISSGTLAINGASLKVEVAYSREDRSKGLAGRERLAESDGMLFVLPDPIKPTFWMKDMKFPIDILFLNRAWEVVDVKPDFRPESYPETFTPKEKTKYILEVNAGLTKKHSIRQGDQAVFKADRQ